MMIAYAHGAHDFPGYPVQFAQSDAMLEDSVTSVKTLYNKLITLGPEKFACYNETSFL